MRMLDAMAEAPPEVEARPVRSGVVAWGAFAASAAAIAVVLLMTPLRTPRIPERTTHPAPSSQPAPRIFAEHPAPASPAELRASENVPVAPPSRAVEVSHEAVGATRAEPHRPPLAEYAVSFGEFVNRTTADTMMHLIRSKGYIVYVARSGESFWVMTRPYRTRAQAERLANALQDIGLPAQLANSRAI
jgi:cell division septation protein DedD